ncbi:Hedgehog protein [Fasciola gigantica]|uniref:Hedgehog protein n=1 Tax=Fasciola gigantica TaxID=46835 RepID=A0A504YRS7_FASGI|nr:Hedgehog protein [Fasciola gigantica]
MVSTKQEPLEHVTVSAEVQRGKCTTYQGTNGLHTKPVEKGPNLRATNHDVNKGCRDRLLKLSTQIQNTWAKQDVILRVLRAWTEPPPQYKQRPASSESGTDTADSNESEAESLLYNHDSIDNGDQTTSRMPKQQTASTYVSASSHRTAGFVRPQSSNDLNPANIIDMTPEMLVDESHPESVEQTPTSRSHPMNIQYNYLSPNPSPSPTSTLKWPSMQSYRPSSAARIYSTRSDQSYIQQSQLRYYSSAMDSNPPVGRSFRSTSSTKMMRLPRNIRQMGQTSSETAITSTIAAITTHTALNPTKSNRKVGRSVHSLPMPLDTGYTSVNTMSQLAFEQWLQMRMEEFHYAGRAVDVQLVPRGGGYIDMRNPEFSLGVLAQIAYYVAQFDWCYLSRSGHVHCSVKPGECPTL